MDETCRYLMHLERSVSEQRAAATHGLKSLVHVLRWDLELSKLGPFLVQVRKGRLKNYGARYSAESKAQGGAVTSGVLGLLIILIDIA